MPTITLTSTGGLFQDRTFRADTRRAEIRWMGTVSDDISSLKRVKWPQMSLGDDGTTSCMKSMSVTVDMLGQWVKRGPPPCLIGDSGTGTVARAHRAGATRPSMAGFRVRHTLATKLVNDLVTAAGAAARR